MSDEPHSGTGDRALFTAIDAKLNMFALANGMDLLKGDADRRLEWFTDGMERGIVIEAATAGPAGSFRVRVISWPTGSAESIAGASDIGDSLSAEDVTTVLADAIDVANRL